jgi:ATP-dependent DNA helicase RecQ
VKVKNKHVAAAEGAVITPESAALEKRLRLWRGEYAKSSGKPAFVVLHDRTIRALAVASPRNMAELFAVDGMGPAKAEQFGEDVLAICRGGGAAPSDARTPRPRIERLEAGGEVVSVGRSARVVAAAPQQKRAVVAAIAELGAAQAEIEERLKVWRREEAAKAGLPSFFVFSDTVLRNIVVAGPGSLAELREVRGVGAEKLERFGAAVVRIVTG